MAIRFGEIKEYLADRQEVTLFEFILKDDRFRKVSREELED